MELWDDELQVDVHPAGIFTLPEMELPFGELAPLMEEIERVAGEILTATSSWSRSAANTRSRRRSSRRRPAPTRASECCRSTRMPTCATVTWGRRHNHACAMRRSLEYAPVTQVGIRSMSTEEAEAVSSLRDDDLLRPLHAAGAGLD